MKLFKDYGYILLDFFEIILIGVAVFFVVYLFMGQLMEVSGDSMLPNFSDKEQLVAEKLTVKINPLTRGEVVIFRHPQEPAKLLIKRVIGLPGERFKISNGKVYINDQPLDEPYLPKGAVTLGKDIIRENEEFTIDPNNYVVLGDNRENSSDSREWGELSSDLVIGRGVLVYYPLSKFRIIR